jgi:hypothetical protein
MTQRKKTALVPTPSGLLTDIRALIDDTRTHATTAIKSELSMLYWRVGQRIHAEVLEGKLAEYGEEVLRTLAGQFVKVYGGSFAEKNLRRCSVNITPSPSALSKGNTGKT